MKNRLNYDEKDPNFTLLSEIFKHIDSRSSEKIFASFGFKQIKKLQTSIKTIFTGMFFDEDMSFIVSEFKRSETLRKEFNISNVLEDLAN